ncbi:MAG: RagB/SusD family nutrient uptake outer membrane protein [Butyricimonas faecihominis]
MPDRQIQDLRREIFNERDRELFGEGQRYFDIIRNGYLDRLSEAYQQLTAKDIENGALYRPVAQRSFNNNELMTQNKYWLWRR